MTNCHYCKNELLSLPFTCKRCGKKFCTYHRLPEDHKCPNLKRGNVFEQAYKKEKPKKKGEKKGGFHKVDDHHKVEYVGKRPENKSPKTEKPTSNKKSDKVKHHARKAKNYAKRNLKPRKHHLKGLLKHSIITGALIILFITLLANKEALNEITFWIIRLGGLLLLINAFFIVKYGYKLVKYLYRTFGHSNNHLKYVGAGILLILLLFAFQHRESLMDDLVDKYKTTDKSIISPLSSDWDDTKAEISNTAAKVESATESAGEKYKELNGKPEFSIAELEAEIHDLTNAARKRNGVPALKYDSKLASIARKHSQDMANKGYFSHTNLKGEDPTDRGNNAGYPCKKDYGSYYSYGLAENIAQDNLYSSYTTYNLVITDYNWNTMEEIAASIVNGWMNSPGHRENILTRSYGKEGIGIAINDDDEVLATQNFC